MKVQSETKRQKFMDNVLDLSVNSGKINEEAKYILYSEESKECNKYSRKFRNTSRRDI